MISQGHKKNIYILLNRLNIEWINQKNIIKTSYDYRPCIATAKGILYDCVLIGVALVCLNNLNLNSNMHVKSIYSV